MAGELKASQIFGGDGPSTPGEGGALPVGYIYFTGAGTADLDQVSIAGRSYEFDTDATSTGDVAVDISGGGNPAQSAAALAAAINGDPDRLVEAIVVGAGSDIVALVGIADDEDFTLVEDTDSGGTIEISGAELQGGGEARATYFVEAYGFSAADVTALNPAGLDGAIPVLGVRATAQPFLVTVAWNDGGEYKDISEMTNRSLTWRQVAGNFFILEFDDGAAADVADGDLLVFTVSVQ